MSATVTERVTTAGGFVRIPIDRVIPNPDQPRKRFDEEPLAELAASIRESGLLQPVTVRKAERGLYVIIAGERRWRASKRAGLTAIPARVMDLPEDDAYVLSVAENLTRADMTVMEEVDAFGHLTRRGYTVEALARLFGKTRTYIEWRLGMADLTDEVRKMVDDGVVKPNLAWHIARLAPTNQSVVARRYARGDFGSETEAANFAQAMRDAEAQTSLFRMESEEPDVERRERVQAARRQAKSKIDRLSGVAALLGEIAQIDPRDFAEAAGDDTATWLAALDHVADLAGKARSVARKAKGHAEARTYILNT